MNAKERIMKTLNHEEPDKVPAFEGSIDNLTICEHYGEKYGYQGIGKTLKLVSTIVPFKNKIIRKLFSSESAVKKSIRATARLYRKIGIDLLAAPLSMFPVKFYKWGYVDEFGRTFRVTINPSDNMELLYYNGGLFKNFEDYENFEFHPDPDERSRKLNFDAQKEVSKEFKNEIYIIPGTGALLEMVWESFGMENFVKLLKKPKQIKKIFDDRGQFCLELIKRCMEWGAETILLWDDYGYKSGLFLSPNYFEKYIFPWLKRICKQVHENGGKILLHSCGDISKIFEKLIECGIDGFNPIEPTTANPDYDIFKLKKMHGEKITLIGNISPQDLADKNPQYIEEYTKKLIKNCAPGGGYIISSGHSINPSVKLENFLKYRETVERYGKYPINLS